MALSPLSACGTLGIASPLFALMRSFVPSSSIRARIRVGSPDFGSSSITFECVDRRRESR